MLAGVAAFVGGVGFAAALALAIAGAVVEVVAIGGGCVFVGRLLASALDKGGFGLGVLEVEERVVAGAGGGLIFGGH